MKVLLIVFFLVDGGWVQGKASEGWGAYSYETEESCLAGKARAEDIHVNLKQVNPRAVDKRFECIAEQTATKN